MFWQCNVRSESFTLFDLTLTWPWPQFVSDVKINVPIELYIPNDSKNMCHFDTPAIFLYDSINRWGYILAVKTVKNMPGGVRRDASRPEFIGLSAVGTSAKGVQMVCMPAIPGVGGVACNIYPGVGKGGWWYRHILDLNIEESTDMSQNACRRAVKT